MYIWFNYPTTVWRFHYSLMNLGPVRWRNTPYITCPPTQPHHRARNTYDVSTQQGSHKIPGLHNTMGKNSGFTDIHPISAPLTSLGWVRGYTALCPRRCLGCGFGCLCVFVDHRGLVWVCAGRHSLWQLWWLGRVDIRFLWGFVDHDWSVVDWVGYIATRFSSLGLCKCEI